MLAPDYGQVARARCKSPPAVVAFIVGSGVLQALYSSARRRHARRVLLALFCLLAPVGSFICCPTVRTFRGRPVAGLVISELWQECAGWSLCGRQTRRGVTYRVTYSGIVDERRFYALARASATAADHLDYPAEWLPCLQRSTTPRGVACRRATTGAWCR